MDGAGIRAPVERNEFEFESGEFTVNPSEVCIDLAVALLASYEVPYFRRLREARHYQVVVKGLAEG